MTACDNRSLAHGRGFQLMLVLLVNMAAAGVVPLAAANAPLPPQQGAAWTPPEDSHLDPLLLRACRELCAAGLPDPRGCAYRAIAFPSYAAGWGAVSEDISRSTTGWVLPPATQDPGEQRYAIGWNGLVYPLLWIGPAADVGADCAQMVPESDLGANGREGGPPGPPPGISIEEQLAPRPLLPLRLVLAARAGAWRSVAGMVERLRNAPPDDGPIHGGDELAAGQDPLPLLAASWLASCYERALAARSLGDDATALASLRLIARAEPLLVRASGVALEQVKPHQGRLADWSDWRDVLADQLRRPDSPWPPLLSGESLAEGDQRLEPLSGRSALTDTPWTPARILQAIHRLEDATACGAVDQGFCGSRSFDLSAAVWTLVDAGPEAIEPLLACIRSDTRLTRGIGADGRLEPVWLPAAEAVRLICLPTELESRYEAPDELRAWALGQGAAFGRLGIPERCYRILAGDRFSPEAWASAAQIIVDPGALANQLPMTWRLGRRRLSWATADAHAMAEALRANHSPPVTTLMRDRLRLLLAEVPDGQCTGAMSIARLTVSLAAWDGAPSLPLMRQASDQLASWMRPGNEWLRTRWLQTIIARGMLEDRSGMDSYAEWLIHADASAQTEAVSYAPLLWFPRDPVLARALPAAVARWPIAACTLVASSAQHLVQQPAVRAWLAQRLGDQQPAASPAGMPTVADLRACDLCASALASLPGFPLFKESWARPQRDAAIAVARLMLARCGPWYRRTAHHALTDALEPAGWFANLCYDPPHLDHPATAAECAAGQAIFSLGPTPSASASASAAAVRIDAMTSARLLGRGVLWSQSRLDRQDLNYQDQYGNDQHAILYDNIGRIAQVEERLEPDRWHTWVGLVFKHHLVQLPVEELKIPDDYDAWKTDRAWECHAGIDPGAPVDISGYPRGGLGHPPLVLVRVRNLLLSDQAVPRRIADAADGSWWVEVDPEMVRCAVPGPLDPGHVGDAVHGWQILPPRAPLLLARGGGQRGAQVGPGGYVPDQAIDLARWWDLSQPGSYAFRLNRASPWQMIRFRIAPAD